MKLLIIYSTTEGQTKKIGEFLRDEATKNNHDVEIMDVRNSTVSPVDFDTIVIAASVHAGKYQPRVEQYIMEHNDELNDVKGAFISVSLTAAGDDAVAWKNLKKITSDFLIETGWEPDVVEYVAGALRYSKYNFIKKWIMRMIAKKSGGGTDTTRDYEYTDWNQVRNILEQLDKTSWQQAAVR